MGSARGRLRPFLRAAGQPKDTCKVTMASMLENAGPAVPSLALPQPAQTDAVDAAFQRAAAERHARATPVRGAAVLRFTTLSNDAPRRGFVIGDRGTVGRGQQNHIQVASDATLCETKSRHLPVPGRRAGLGAGERRRGGPVLHGRIDRLPSANGLRVRLRLVHLRRVARRAARAVLPRGAAAGADAGRAGGADLCGRVALSVRPLPRVEDTGVVLGSNCKFVPEGADVVCMLLWSIWAKSTNGTYVRRVGPYAGPHRMRIGDKVLLGRTGLELCRFDVGVCSLKGARRTMEDRTTIVHDLRCSNLPPALRPVYYAAVYDGHGGDACAQFLKDELHGYVRSRWMPNNWSNAETTINAAARRVPAMRRCVPRDESVRIEPGSTACILLVFGQAHMSCANVGDSRCCLATASACVQLSRTRRRARGRTKRKGYGTRAGS